VWYIFSSTGGIYNLYVYIYINRSSRVGRPLALFVSGFVVYIYSSTGGIYNIFITIYSYTIYMALTHIWPYGSISMALSHVYIYNIYIYIIYIYIYTHTHRSSHISRPLAFPNCSNKALLQIHKALFADI